jgi:Gpi18-like mannosyltransferase
MIVSLFIFWRLGLLLVTFLGSRVFPLVANQSPGAVGTGKGFDYWLSWAQWDGGNYLSIATHGYQNLQYFAFAPLFPFLAKILSLIFMGNVFVAGLVISNLSFLAFLLLFHNFLKKNYSVSIANTTLVTFLTFPTAFFAVAYYSESLFLLFLVIFFIFLTKHNFIKSAFIVILASLTRFIGIFLIISLFYAYLTRIKFKANRITITFVGLFISFFGVFIFSIITKVAGGHFLQFLLSQSFWQRQPSDPVSTLFSYIWSFATFQHRPPNDYFDFAQTLAFIGLLIWGIRKIPSSLWLFSALAILIPASSGTLSSIPRYALASLGSFVIIGKTLETYPKLKIPFWTASLFLQALLAILFINGYWVA